MSWRLRWHFWGATKTSQEEGDGGTDDHVQEAEERVRMAEEKLAEDLARQAELSKAVRRARLVQRRMDAYTQALEKTYGQGGGQ